MKYIDKIKSPADLKKLPVAELDELAAEIRTLLITKLSEHGGHCGPNLGMVEATIEDVAVIVVIFALGIVCEIGAVIVVLAGADIEDIALYLKIPFDFCQLNNNIITLFNL